MPPFKLTRRIHFGYMREPGIYHDLTDADIANLSAARDGAPNGYGHRVDEIREILLVPRADMPQYPAPEPAAVEPARIVADPQGVAPSKDPADATNSEAPPAIFDSNPPDAGGTGSDDPVTPSTDPEPRAETFACPFGCNDGQPFRTAAALASHQRAKHREQ